MSIYEYEATTADGKTYPLSNYKGKTLLIVNTATKCGLTDQFESLEKLYKKHQENGLVVLGFPSNQFKQELSSGEEAAEACKMTYGVTFPMHDLVKVNGKEADPLFNYLTENSNSMFGKNIKWNFTKFLIDRNGKVVKRFSPKDKPESFEEEIVKALSN